jgi:hypothetical protein
MEIAEKWWQETLIKIESPLFIDEWNEFPVFIITVFGNKP